MRRIIDKQRIFSAHKLHLYQRLNEGKLTNLQIVVIYFLAILINCMVYFYLNFLLLFFSNNIWTILGIYLNNTLAVPFKTIKKNS